MHYSINWWHTGMTSMSKILRSKRSRKASKQSLVVCLSLALVPNHCLCSSFVTQADSIGAMARIFLKTLENHPALRCWFNHCEMHSSITDLPNKGEHSHPVHFENFARNTVKYWLVGWWPTHHCPMPILNTTVHAMPILWEAGGRPY